VTARAPDQPSTDKLRDVYRFTPTRTWIIDMGHALLTARAPDQPSTDKLRDVYRFTPTRTWIIDMGHALLNEAAVLPQESTS